jgi:hypothetical protein
MLESAARSVNKIGDRVEEYVLSVTRTGQTLTYRIKNTDAQKLQDEYEKLVSGLQQANETREDEDMMASPGTCLSLRGGRRADDQCCRKTCWMRLFLGISEKQNISSLS